MGIEGNEIADVRANNGSEITFIGAEHCSPVSPSSLKQLEIEVLLKHWQSVIISRQAKNCLSINKKNIKFFPSLSIDPILHVTMDAPNSWTSSPHEVKLNY